MTGGRQWDVRVTPKMPLRGGVEEKPRSLFGRLRQALFGGSAAGVEEEKTQQEWFEVCKPKLGDRIVNGGFVGMWVKVDP
ncbi:hypothetical protein FH972_025970 [Carpinus fangiana]|uniref:Uncharacterized protein n=1 Tax=Carpinus fangiana TaxID=176857 RepID=A0A5N6L2K3_9ROSI|nr:hypothetical protein FH972_025970 [Carpinus fangiana]